ncbi:AcrB/AcrD/AcrF family protein, partial [candidate division KSB1 bacterium]
MKLPEFGVRRPVFTTMIFVGIVLLGIVALNMLPIDLMPKMEIPTMAVITFYRGAGAEDIETKITKVIEEQVSTTPNIKEVTSTSEENLSVVTMRFEWGTDLDEAANDVRQRLDMAIMNLPDDADRPMLFKMDVSMMPVLLFGVTAQQSYPQLRDIIDNKFCDPLKRIPGVAMATIMGGLEREIQVNIDRQRLEAYHLSITQVTAMLAAENLTLPAGDLKIGRTDYIIRVPGEFRNVEEIGDVVVGNFNGTPIYLRDIAQVKDSFKEKERRVRINREEGLIVMVQKQSGANTVTVANRIKKTLPKLEKKLPPDVKVVLIMDSSEFIIRSINNLASTVGWALLFVVLVVFFFLREIRGSLIIAVTIPVSLVVAFGFLYVGGYTINMMSLSAIAIALGMVVDNAIVIYENIYRHHSGGESRREASIFGAGEVGTAVMASTFTTIAIFFPIIFVKGLTGIMFRELGLVVMIVLAASLFSALTLTPMLSSQFMRVPLPGEERKGLIRRFHDFSEKWFTGLEATYRRVLNWALNHRKIV